MFFRWHEKQDILYSLAEEFLFVFSCWLVMPLTRVRVIENTDKNHQGHSPHVPCLVVECSAQTAVRLDDSPSTYVIEREDH